MLRTHARVVHALVLRDIQTRAGSSYFGFLFGLVMPLGHLGAVLLTYILLGRKPAIGTDTLLFLTSAILPFIVWSYTHQKIIVAFSQNKALTAFPIVGLSEIAVARAIVELFSSVLVASITLIMVWFIGTDMFFYDPKMLLFCFVVAYFLGIGTGLVFGVLSILNSFIGIIGYLLIPIFWLSCGVLFIPSNLPLFVKNIISIFAIAHIVDFARMAIYSEYYSEFPSVALILTSIFGNMLLFFIIIRFMRVSLTSR